MAAAALTPALMARAAEESGVKLARAVLDYIWRYEIANVPQHVALGACWLDCFYLCLAAGLHRRANTFCLNQKTILIWISLWLFKNAPALLQNDLLRRMANSLFWPCFTYIP
jgi:hypothetical protein